MITYGEFRKVISDCLGNISVNTGAYQTPKAFNQKPLENKKNKSKNNE